MAVTLIQFIKMRHQFMETILRASHEYWSEFDYNALSALAVRNSDE
jgi:hypothetical protein